MDVSKPRTPDARADAARRRLELLGIQLSAESPPAPTSHPAAGADPPAPTPAARGGTATGGRHRAGPRPDAVLSDRFRSRLGGAVASPGFTVQHVVVVIVVVVGFACLAAWWVISSRPSELRPITAPQRSASAPAPGTVGPATSATSASPSGDVVVDVSGKVRKPGIVTLPVGSRVADAVRRAGGARSGVSLAGLNLARVLVDGEQILVGVDPVGGGAGAAPPSPGSATSPDGAPTALVNLNTATMEQLDTLPGVGPVTAQSILDWRTEHGRFTAVDELLEVKGIGEATLADLRDRVTV